MRFALGVAEWWDLCGSDAKGCRKLEETRTRSEMRTAVIVTVVTTFHFFFCICIKLMIVNCNHLFPEYFFLLHIYVIETRFWEPRYHKWAQGTNVTDEWFRLFCLTLHEVLFISDKTSNIIWLPHLQTRRRHYCYMFRVQDSKHGTFNLLRPFGERGGKPGVSSFVPCFRVLLSRCAGPPSGSPNPSRTAPGNVYLRLQVKSEYSCCCG